MKGVAIAFATPFVLVLLLGAGMSAPDAGQPPATSFPASMPAPPTPFAGVSRGCTVADPTGTGGCVTPAVAWLLVQVEQTFGTLPTSCWDEHAWNPTSDHPKGKACDVTFGELGTFPSAAEVERGWTLAHWLEANAAALRVRYLIWQGRVWRAARSGDGWLPYSGGGVYDPQDPTGGHYDHVHISTTT